METSDRAGSVAMILEPDVILMDEPLRNVSPKFHNQLTQELVELQERTGVTILYATKNVEEMALLGKLKSDGVKLKEIYY